MFPARVFGGRSAPDSATSALSPRRSRIRIYGWATLGLALLSVVEFQTSSIQARFLHLVASQLAWNVAPGESPRLVFPRHGPFDVASGYTGIPAFRDRLEDRGFRVARQARFSSGLAMAASLGLSPPGHERAVSGLVIRGRRGSIVYDATGRL
jgi:hypothetical protein